MRERDVLLERVAREIDLLSQLKEAIEADDISKVQAFKTRVMPIGENLVNAIKPYVINHQNRK